VISPDIEHLIRLFSKLPGFGPRSARRAVLHLLKNKTQKMIPLMDQMRATSTLVDECTECKNLDTVQPCSLCQCTKRNTKVLCVVESVSDLWAIERAGGYRGVYHVLGGVLSSFNGIGPDNLHIPHLINRIRTSDIQEVILALNTTLEGQTTAHYLSNELVELNVKVTALAQGIPLGGELDYLDAGTIIAAVSSRRMLAEV
jgi:recombination protein RecR